MMLVLNVLYLLMCFLKVSSHEDDNYTLKYNNENFSVEVPKKNHFVMFYAPWYVIIIKWYFIQ